MIKNLNIIQYRKLKDLTLRFTKNINAVSGTNGTCKTSLLHLLSNSLQAPIRTNNWIIDKKCLPIIKAVNNVTNPKVESLTRGDQTYNDPAHGVKGPLFSVDYYGADSLNFRRHNSSQTTRYSVKPKYQPGTQDTLPYCPVIYLGLSRLVPFGEFQNDDTISNIKKKLPQSYQNEIAELYKNFTNYEILFNATKQMGDIKVRSEFSSNVEGIDSNTISAGEDNLSIILTALISLKYYYESISSNKEVESVLLIDEMDATLHPAFQIKLLNLFRKMSEAYKIQVVFTTHSMSLLEEMLTKKDNVLYLIDNVTSVFQMEEPDIYKIKMHLHSLTQEDIYEDKVIPLFTEDDEARCLLELLFDYYQKKHPEFRNVSGLFHKVITNISAENLVGIFTDSKLLHTTMRSICILDGDHKSDLTNFIIALPGKGSPEEVLLTYIEKLFDDDDSFWRNKTIVDKGYSKNYYITNVKNKVADFEAELVRLQDKGKSIKGKRRVFNKNLFNDNQNFFKLVFKHWINNTLNKSEVERFYDELRTLFLKVAPYHEINPKEWA
ncbi:AAA family ATPase [Faecalicoccus pleomorphus]|uniref:AAA family ATPase n=1 Tax=Faecalicoccus pleomorphus TaxID=1323 RepID=UPI003DA32F6D